VKQKHKTGNHSFIKHAQLLGLIFLTHIFFPLPAYANGMPGIILAPFYWLFLIFLSTGLAAFFKFLLVKIALGKRPWFSKRYLLKLAILEMTLIALFIMPAYFLMPQDIALGITGYALCVSDDLATWYFKIFSSYEFVLFWCVVLSISSLINLIFAILHNLELLLFSLIAPAILSMIILFPLILQTPHPNPPKYSTTLRDKNRALNEMFIRAASTKYPKLVEAFLKKGADVNAKDRNGFTALMGAVFPGVKRAIFLEVQIEV
jgi:hypothetical protein